jgi:lysophospholipase L1-like esterase
MRYGKRDHNSVMATTRSILCYGDSLTAGYCRDGTVFTPYSTALEDASLGVVDTNGMSGWTTEDMIDNLDATECSDFCGRDGKGLRVLTRNKDYDWVFLLAGTNDLGMDIEAGEIFENICTLIDVCVDVGVRNVGIMTVPACGLEWKYPPLREERTKLNGFIVNLPYHQKYQGLSIHPVDITEILPNGEQFTRQDKTITSLWDSDELHFSPAGSQKLGHYLVSVVVNNST